MVMAARFAHLLIVAAAVCGLAACQTTTPPQATPQISFAGKAPIALNVGQLEIVPEYQPSAKRPNVEHLMPLSPEAATVRWAQERLHPMGRSGTARVVIRDASVVEVPLKTEKGFTGLFKEEQAERYDAILDVAIQIQDERHLTQADVVARATRSRTVPEGVTLNERDRILNEITETLIRDIDSQIDGLIRTYLARWMM